MAKGSDSRTLGLILMASACFPGTRLEGYQRHALHDSARAWPETNCYVDVWIEILSQLGLQPQAALAFTLTQDFEGDQFTFFKYPLEDLETIYGIKVQELAIFDDVAAHITRQLERRRLCLVEMDSFYLPDTHGIAYQIEHGKTTVAVNRLDIIAKSMEYFHNGGYFSLSGADFDGVFQKNPGDALFLPYTEFAKFEGVLGASDTVRRSVRLLSRHLARKPSQNPISQFAAVFPDQARELTAKPEGFFHKYAFNTLRQLGANFELLSSYLAWLEQNGERDLTLCIAAAETISNTAKAAQFQLARALARQKFDALGTLLEPAAQAWQSLMADLDARYGL